MIAGACHCGAIRFELDAEPAWLSRCNCSYCRRAGGLWAHASPRQIRLHYAPSAAIRYVWGDRTLAFVSCATCGCTTHWESLDPASDRMAVNCSMAEPGQIARFRVRDFDGASTWEYFASGASPRAARRSRAKIEQ